jgi:hypothetical protein
MNSYRTAIPRAAAHKRSQKDRSVTVITKRKKEKAKNSIQTYYEQSQS